MERDRESTNEQKPPSLWTRTGSTRAEKRAQPKTWQTLYRREEGLGGWTKSPAGAASVLQGDAGEEAWAPTREPTMCTWLAFWVAETRGCRVPFICAL